MSGDFGSRTIVLEEERQKEQRRIEYLKEEERKQKKVNDFMNPKD